MVVKIKCKQCEKTWKIKRKTIKEARNAKKKYKECICDKCKFRLKVRSIVKEIVSGVNYDTYR